MKTTLVSALAYALPALTILLGIPLMLEWVPPNRFYGYRTQATLASPELWYATNRATGIALLIAGALGLAGVVAIALLGADWPEERRQTLAFCWQGICVLAAIAVVAVSV